MSKNWMLNVLSHGDCKGNLAYPVLIEWQWDKKYSGTEPLKIVACRQEVLKVSADKNQKR